MTDGGPLASGEDEVGGGEGGEGSTHCVGGLEIHRQSGMVVLLALLAPHMKTGVIHQDDVHPWHNVTSVTRS